MIEFFWGRYALENESLPHDYTWRIDKHWEDGELVTDRPVPKAASDAILLDGDDKTVLRYAAWALAMTVGWLMWYDWVEGPEAESSNFVT